jgi:hypothetical protein
MTEIEMIEKQEELIKKFEILGYDMSTSWRFFNVGEWLICFEGIELAAENEPINDEAINSDINDVRNYFL